jgi:hypothetical protein
VLTYREMMRRYARVAGLPRRQIFTVPVLTPWLSSHWVGVVTPVPNSIARPLVGSLIHEVVCADRDITTYVPDPKEGLIGFDRAVTLALERVQDAAVTSRWTSASTSGAPSDPMPSDPDWAGGSLYVDTRSREVDAPPERLWSVILGIGGGNGWYSWPLAWEVRGVLDRLSGGPGLRRGRTNPKSLNVGEALDWWRVEDIVPGRKLRLRAEMRVPGQAWLDLEVQPTHPPGSQAASRGAGGIDDAGASSCTFTQTAYFHPRGLAGQLYWWSVAPFHGIVFGGMQRNIARAAESSGTGPGPRSTAQTGDDR